MSFTKKLAAITTGTILSCGVAFAETVLELIENRSDYTIIDVNSDSPDGDETDKCGAAARTNQDLTGKSCNLTMQFNIKNSHGQNIDLLTLTDTGQNCDTDGWKISGDTRIGGNSDYCIHIPLFDTGKIKLLFNNPFDFTIDKR